MANESTPVIRSLLDSDLYKYTMQQAVLEHFPTSRVEYRFTNRGGTLFSRPCFEAIQSEVLNLADLKLTPSERSWLAQRCPYFSPSYLDYLEAFRFRPAEQIVLAFVVVENDARGVEWGNLELEVKGGWAETILYEIPLMSLISETYFRVDDTAWDYRGQFAEAKQKGKELFEAGCIVSEFGTRRRRSHLGHDIVMRGLIAASEEYGKGEGRGKLAGTSNVSFAEQYDVAPIGTIAHEFYMGIAAIEGYEHANGRAMDLWDITYPSGSLNIALTDTFSTQPFFDDFVADPVRANKWKGLRQDSGDPFKFIPVAIEAFKRVGADPKTKVIVFSDALDVERCNKLKKASDEAGIGCSFGVGTYLTNDYKKVANPLTQEVPGEGEIREEKEKSKALNMVIKLYKIDESYCVKISDELTKNTGFPEAVRQVKEQLHLGDGAKVLPVAA